MKIQQLTHRAVEILNLTYEHGFARTDYIARYLYQGRDPSGARHLIVNLERSGLIRRDSHLQLGRQRLIRLTRSGVQMIEGRRTLSIPQRRQIDPRTLLHDSFVLATRLRLTHFWDAHWVPERLLKAEEFDPVPDGVLAFESGFRVAIEVENTVKAKERFQKLLRRWSDIHSVQMILYIATSPEVERFLRREIPKAPEGLPLGMLSFAALDSGAPLIWTAQGELDLLSRRSLE